MPRRLPCGTNRYFADTGFIGHGVAAIDRHTLA